MSVSTLIAATTRIVIPRKENENFFYFTIFSIYIIISLDLSQNYLPSQWGKFGFEYNNESFLLTIFLLLVSILPAFVLRKKYEKVSDFFNIIFYLTVYIPTIIVVGAIDTGDGSIILPLATAYLCAMSIMALMPRIALTVNPRHFIQPHHVESTVLIIGLLVTAYFGLKYAAVFNVVGQDQTYVQRALAAKQFTGADAYLYSWSESALLPILVVMACYRRRLRYAFCAIALCLVLFGILSTKSSLINLVAPVILYALFNAFRKDTPVFIVIGACTLSMIAVLSTINVFDWRGQIATFWAFRSVGLPAIFSYQYQEFFSENGHTFLSHAFPFRYFIEYPYELPMFNEIALHYYGTMSQPNAHFLATDGSGGFGLVGVPLMGFVCACVFMVADAITRHLPQHIVPVMLFGFATFMTNVSLFTSILTGGLFLMLLIAFLWRPKVSDAPAPRWSF